MSAGNGAAYMNITSSDGDRLLSAGADTSVAGTVEIHETVAAEGDTSDDGMGGMMMMRPVDGIDLPAGQTVSLAPGGYHIMLIDLAKPLELGNKFNVTLTFEKAGVKTVEVEVRDAQP
jgi:hypothetical protein